MNPRSVIWMLTTWLAPSASPVGFAAPSIPGIVPVREAFVVVLRQLGRHDLVPVVDRRDDVVDLALTVPAMTETTTITLDIVKALLAWMRELRAGPPEAEVPASDDPLLEPLGQLYLALMLFVQGIVSAGVIEGDSAESRSAEGMDVPGTSESVLTGHFVLDDRQYEARVAPDLRVTVAAEDEQLIGREAPTPARQTRIGEAECLGEWNWIRTEILATHPISEGQERLVRAAAMALRTAALSLARPVAEEVFQFALDGYEALVGPLSAQTRRAVLAGSAAFSADQPLPVRATGRAERTPADLDLAHRARWFVEQIEHMARILDGTALVMPGVSEVEAEGRCRALISRWISDFTRFTCDPEKDDFGFRFFVMDAVQYVAQHDISSLVREYRPDDPAAAERFDACVAPHFTAARRVRRLLNVHRANAANLDDTSIEAAVRAWTVRPGHPRRSAKGEPERMERWAAIYRLLGKAPGRLPSPDAHKKYWTRQPDPYPELALPALRDSLSRWREAELLSFLMFYAGAGAVPTVDISRAMDAIAAPTSRKRRKAAAQRAPTESETLAPTEDVGEERPTGTRASPASRKVPKAAVPRDLASEEAPPSKTSATPLPRAPSASKKAATTSVERRAAVASTNSSKTADRRRPS